MHSIVHAALAAATVGLAGAALAQGSTLDEIAKYREMLGIPVARLRKQI